MILTNKAGEFPILEISDVLRGNQGVQIVVIRLEPRNVHSVGIHERVYGILKCLH